MELVADLAPRAKSTVAKRAEHDETSTPDVDDATPAEAAMERVFARPPDDSASAVGRLVQRSALSHPANASVRATALRRTQHVHGNRIAQRAVVSPARTPWPPVAQRACECGGTCDACRHDVDRSPDLVVPPAGRGAPLDQPTRDFMEPRFGYDFADVRVHTDAQAARSAQRLDAAAYTLDRNIVFAAGQYAPGTSQGRRLLAHELAHTVQQTGAIARQAAGGAPPLDLGPPPPDRPLRPHVPDSPRGGQGAAVTIPPSSSGPTCWTGDVCGRPVAGSASEFATSVAQKQAQKPQNPARPPAAAITAFVNTQSPGLLGVGARVIVNPNIGDTAGAQADQATRVIEVPTALEREAAEFNAVPEVPAVGGRPRASWRFNTLRIMTHEMAHIRFAVAPPSGLPQVGSVGMFELDELNAQLSEFPGGYGFVMATEPDSTEQAERIQRAINIYIEKRGEGIRGILTKLRCNAPCDAVNTAVRRVFEAQTASWPRAVRDVLLSGLADPSNRLQWPMPPPPRPGLPAAPRSAGMGGVQQGDA